MGFIREFREFAVKGNVIDLAVGVIIGAAFAKIIDSIINDLVMPIIARLIGAPDLVMLTFHLRIIFRMDCPLRKQRLWDLYLPMATL